MDPLQFSGRQTGLGIPLVVADFVAKPEFLEEPEDALRARVIQVMDGKQRLPKESRRAEDARRSFVPLHHRRSGEHEPNLVLPEERHDELDPHRRPSPDRGQRRRHSCRRR